MIRDNSCFKKEPFIEFLFDMNYHELPMNYHKLIHSTLTPSTFGSEVKEVKEVEQTRNLS